MKRLVALAVFVAIATTALGAAAEMRVGSKRFVESYVLAEIVTQAAQAAGGNARHEQGLGGTAVTFRAVEEGSIDVYPEYTGTIAETAVPGTKPDLASLRAALAAKGLAISDPIGFENTYALALTRPTAERLGVKSLSELAKQPRLRFALSHEFVGRSDGWSGLASRYDIRAMVQTSIDHALAYEAIARGDTDVIDVYTTDAKIARFDLVVLADDRRYFPPYEAVLVYRADLAMREPAFAKVLERLRGSIDAKAMQRLNARVDLDGLTAAAAAAEHLGTAPAARTGAPRAGQRPGIVAGTIASIEKHGPRHLMLVFVSVILSTLVGVPLGVVAFSRKRVGAAVLGVAGIVQTIPSLALFCFMIPLLGIGPLPALVALFLYGLLPIVRNTHAGLSSIPADLREAALALGLSPRERLRHVELPLASRTILAGVKTSAVVAVGSATIAAFIGAGGFGDPISTGLSLNDVPMILEGAIPAALLALLVELAFALVERPLVPRT